MPTVNFYELQITPVDKVLPQLVLKAYEQGLRGVVLASDKERLDELNKVIWTFKQDAFIPHGTAADGKPENQNFFLTLEEENPNNSSLAFITDGRVPAKDFEKHMDIFDGTISAELGSAKARMEQYKSKGFEVSHFRQNEKGGWDRV